MKRMHTSAALNVDVGIPALNEEANIKRVLSSITKQRAENFHIQNIFIVSDGSTDNTVAYAKRSGIPNLVIIENNKRMGPAMCWGKLFRVSNADVLILLDADIELSHEDVFIDLLRPMLTSANTTLTSGHPIKQNTFGFTDKVMDISLYLQDYIKLNLNRRQSIYGCHGRITAVKRSIFKQIEFPPKHILGNDSYLYLINKELGGSFEYEPGATILFKMPQSFGDYAKQQRRYAQTQSQHADIFGDWIYEEYRIPKKILVAALFHVFREYPTYTCWYMLFQIRSRLFERNRVITKASWEAPTTTKSLD